MVSLETIEREIDELLSRDTTYAVCERLAWLYVVRDHLRASYKASDFGAASMSGSEFLEAASAARYEDLMRVLDEHMQALMVVQPRAYESLMSKIRAAGEAS